MPRPTRWLFGSLLAACVACASAHEFWLTPTKFTPAAGEVVGFTVRVGDGYPGEEFTRNPKHIKRFFTLGPEAEALETPIAGRDGGSPAGLFRPSRPGLYVGAYESHFSTIEMDAAKFEAYLREEGLEAIIEARAARGESLAPARERYMRCAKTLVSVGAPGEGPQAWLNEEAGLRLELVPEGNPFLPAENDRLTLRVVFEGAPLHGALVRAFHPDLPVPTVKESTRTDDAGRVEIDLPRGGVWMINVVHMVQAPADSGSDWESCWGSLTVEIPARPFDEKAADAQGASNVPSR